MESKDMSILRLMESLQVKAAQSQRELSKSLGLSLGMVNKLINEMVTQGLLKSDKLVRNKTRYLLTSKGMAEKLNLKKKLVSHYLGSYSRLKQLVKKGIGQIQDKPEKSLLLYGACDLCEIACMISGQINYNQIMVIDDQKAGSTIGGFSIYEEAEMEHMDYEAVLIMETENTNKARTKLIGKGVPSDKIFNIIIQDSIENVYN